MKFILSIVVVAIATVAGSVVQYSGYDRPLQNSVSSITEGIQQKEDQLLASYAQAVCYSGYRIGQHPDRGNGAVNPSREEIIEDLNIISEKMNFKLIRLYDCSNNTETVLQLIKELQLDIKVMLGIWLRAELSNHESCAWLTVPIPDQVLKENKVRNLEELEKGIRLANEFDDIVVAVNVGNEALVEWNDHKVHQDTIIRYVKHVKGSINQAVSVAENYKWWAEQGQTLAEVVDFLAIHIYPVWEGKDIDKGLGYSIENIREVMNSLEGKTIVISEAGWPTKASEFGNNASESHQERYFLDIMMLADQMNITTFFFEAFDEPWKGDPANHLGAEKHWGLFTEDRKPKLAIKNSLMNTKLN
jgi:exo-beta-1,3-glucanase (GH17 family)